MSTPPQSADAQRAFRLLAIVIGSLLIVGIGLLITVVLVYRKPPGRTFSPGQNTPPASAPAASPA